MWWAIVTFTTVGYGDLVPVTTAGRFAGVLLMVGGVALIGTLAATLGSFFSGSDTTGQEGSTPGDDSAAGGVAVQDDLLTEVRSLRAEIADLRRVVERPPA